MKCKKASMEEILASRKKIIVSSIKKPGVNKTASVKKESTISKKGYGCGNGKVNAILGL